MPRVFVLVFALTESMGGGPSPRQEPHDDGCYAVDGRLHSAPFQLGNRLLRSVAAHFCIPIHLDRLVTAC